MNDSKLNDSKLNDFDLIDFQRKARNTTCPQKLFALWDQVCTLYERGQISAYEWNEMKDLYYDYDYAKEKRGTVSSLASFYPLWAGLADETRAAKLVKSIKKFEEKGGLATTDPQTIPLNQIVPGTMPTQWAYPNGWAPLHFITVRGLERYGYHAEAKRIALKWLRTNLDWYNKHGVVLEKYNVVDPSKPPAKGVYPSQTGFGWTNAVFERFCKDYLDKE